MGFINAVKTCFAKYAKFDGRAKKSEFWWFSLFCLIYTLILKLILGSQASKFLLGAHFSDYAIKAFILAILLPLWAVTARRLHDSNKSGWLQLLWILGLAVGPILAVGGWLGLTPKIMMFGLIVNVLSIIMMIYFMSKSGDTADNQYGAPPAN